MHSPIDAATETVLGLKAIRSRLAPDSALGRESARKLPFFGPDDKDAWVVEMVATQTVERWAQSSSELDSVRHSLSKLPALNTSLLQLQSGTPLDGPQLFEIKQFLYYGPQILRGASDIQPICAGLAADLEALRGRIHPEEEPSPRFQLADELDETMAQSRALLRTLRTRVRAVERAAQAEVTASVEGSFDVRGVFRPAKKEPIPAGLKADENDEWVLDHPDLEAALTSLEAQEQHVAAHEARIRADLSKILLEDADTIGAARVCLAEFDVRFAKVRLREEIGGTWAKWSEEREGSKITEGFDPSLLRVIDPQRIDLETSGAIVLTGPNMGGKSALLRMLGCAYWCAQSGLPVPASEFAFRPMHAIIYVGSEEHDAISASEGLSSFGREVRRLVEHWDGPTPRLYLFDELGRGTHPEEGAAIAAEVIGQLRDRGDQVVATTHFPALAAHEGVQHLRIRGLDSDALDEFDPAEGSIEDMREALRRAMDFQPEAAEDAEVPREARLVARALGLKIKSE